MDKVNMISLTNEPGREEISILIDMMVRRALLLTSAQVESDAQKIYSDVSLYHLVIIPIVDTFIKGVDRSTRDMITSKIGALGRCTKLLPSDVKTYSCKDCASDASYSMCEECFMNSCHMGHNFVSADLSPQCMCHCGNMETYINSPPCSKHQIAENSRNLPTYYVERVRNIIRRLFKYLEILCGEDLLLVELVDSWSQMGDILEKFNLNDSLAGPISSYEKTETKNAHRWCVLIFKLESESQQYANFCMRFANPEGKNTELLSELELRGYVCIKLRDTFENCQALGTKIQKFIQDRLPGSRLHCRVVKEYRLFFMKLSNVLIQFIADMCFSKSILCDHASEILFKETSLPEKLFFNRSLWIEIRYFVTYHLLMPTILSRKRGMNLVRFLLAKFRSTLYRTIREKWRERLSLPDFDSNRGVKKTISLCGKERFPV
ncbi:E3 ubiquitin-protein ligase UBR1 [Thelohanellus kitauei]|uniref:E3 ubiquitin-protein ligase n=1 Tax=Thelohanellus kitauei TaxID=669202 RepID=A0A0C2JHH7_THEKT|nr:E3 ubiquitin-protein ligase UBR1 [Thelohanellus kitauei]